MSKIKILNHFFGILGYILLGIILSGEAARYLYAHPDLWQPYSTEYLLYAFLLGFWFVLAIILLELGLWFRSSMVVRSALCVLALSVSLMLVIGFPYRLHYRTAFDNPFTIVLIAESLVLLFLGTQSRFSKIQTKSATPEMNDIASDF